MGREDIMVKMQGGTIAGLLAAAMLASAPLASAEAHDGGRGVGVGLGLLGAAAVVGSVAALTAGPPVAPVYAAPVYAPPPQVYYAPPPVVYAQPYYAAPPVVYYAPGGYYRRY